jgi:hypothetical protein
MRFSLLYWSMVDHTRSFLLTHDYNAINGLSFDNITQVLHALLVAFGLFDVDKSRCLY